MTFAQDIKQLGKFLKEQGFITVPLNHGKYRSWVKELDSENLVYLYVYINQHRQGSQIGHLIVSPPRGNDDLWERDPLAVGIALAEEWQDENGSFNGYFDDYIHRLNNLLPSTVGLKDAVIREMQTPAIFPRQIRKSANLGCANSSESMPSACCNRKAVSPNCAKPAKKHGSNKKTSTAWTPRWAKNASRPTAMKLRSDTSKIAHGI